MTQDIGTRMKSYEQNRRALSDSVIIRVDGKGFHTWTKQVGARKPYDELISTSMRLAQRNVSKEIQGFRLSYTQSDECTFWLTAEGEKSQLWFDGKMDKLVSVTASMFTHYFNKAFEASVWYYKLKKSPAFFDARAFAIPIDDAANCFYWRELDWRRNSIVMLGRAHFSHKELVGKSANDVKQMLLNKGINWDQEFPWNKYGAFLDRKGNKVYGFLKYDEINELAGVSVTK